jgi:hypothetical protein
VPVSLRYFNPTTLACRMNFFSCGMVQLKTRGVMQHGLGGPADPQRHGPPQAASPAFHQQ